MNIDEDFRRALALHQAGRRADAEQIYRQILAAHPRHAPSLHFLGVAAFQAGDPRRAIELIEAALAIDPSAAETYNNLGVVCQNAGELDRAARAFQRALELVPRYPEALKGLGDVHYVRGQHEQAATHYVAALAAAPRFVEAAMNLGTTYRVLGKPREAEAVFRSAISMRPPRAEDLVQLADLLASEKRWPEAIDLYRSAVEQAPAWIFGAAKLGMALQTAGRVREAIAWYENVLSRGMDDAGLYVGLGDARQLVGDLAEAATAYCAALRKDVRNRFGWAGLGMMRQIAGRYADALACYRRAVALDPDFAQAHFNMASLHLLHGRFEEGWSEYAWRWKLPSPPAPGLNSPLWDGKPTAGALLVQTEQGLGDTLQFIRYVPKLKSVAGRIIVQCEAALASILARMPAVDQVVVRGQPLPEHEAHVPMLGLPPIFETRLTTIPAEVPYLSADPARASRWQAELAGERALRVGIVWRGNPHHRLDVLRSFAATYFVPLARIDGVRLYSLQKGAGSEQLAELPSELGIVNLAERITDLDDTAAILEHLDLLITCDSAPTHLAGALARPVWVPLPYSPDWRWLLEREDSPWYPTMRLFRQDDSCRWEPVFERIASELSALARRHAGRGSESQ